MNETPIPPDGPGRSTPESLRLDCAMTSLFSDAEVKDALKDAYMAECDLLEEYRGLRQSWERNPTMSACASGVKALRKCIALLEKAEMNIPPDGLPADVADVLRDPDVMLPQDAAVADLVAASYPPTVRLISGSGSVVNDLLYSPDARTDT